MIHENATLTTIRDSATLEGGATVDDYRNELDPSVTPGQTIFDGRCRVYRQTRIRDRVEGGRVDRVEETVVWVPERLQVATGAFYAPKVDDELVVDGKAYRVDAVEHTVTPPYVYAENPFRLIVEDS